MLQEEKDKESLALQAGQGNANLMLQRRLAGTHKAVIWMWMARLAFVVTPNGVNVAASLN